MFEKVEINSERWLDLKNLKNEIWKDINGYYGYYKVSNYGRIKQLERYVNSGIKNNSKVKRKEKIKKIQINKLGYLHTTFTINGNCKNYNIHQLVAESFLNKNKYKKMCYEKEDDIKKLEINHKDENPSNCRIDNLEWCTHSYNINYGTRNKKVKFKMRNEYPYAFSVIQKNKNGQFINKYNSLKQAQEITGVDRKCISLCCKGKYKQAGGYIWEFLSH